MDETVAQAEKPEAGWLILVVLALAQFMLVVDVTIVNIALPAIQHTFSMTDASLQWIVTAYALTFGGFLLLGGRNADLFGRKKTFLGGLIVFTLASLGSGLSQSGELLIAFRALQGLAGAYMSPAALSMVLVTYREGSRRNTALAIWGTVAAAGGALGLLFGGIFTQYLGWRWNFFINVPVGVLVFIAAMALIPSYEPQPGKKHLDLLGATLVTGGLMTLVYTLVKAPDYGWLDWRTLALFGVSLLALACFVVNEKLVKRPLMPLHIFGMGNIAIADTLMLLMSAGMFSALFFGTLYVQEVLGYSAVKTGASFTLFPLCVAAAALTVPKLVRRIGYRPILIGAPMLVAAGLFFLSAVPVAGHYWTNAAPGLALMALGMGATFVSSTIAATAGVAGNESGLASGLLTTSQQIGGAIGLATITAVVTSSTTNFFKSIYVPTEPRLLALSAATVHGFQMGFLVGGYIALGAALLAVVFIKPLRTEPAPQPEPEPAFQQAPADVA